MKKIIILFICLLSFTMNVRAIETSGDGVILMEQDSGRILYAKNIDKQKLIASTTKIMTAVLAIESNQLDDVVTIDDSVLKAYGSGIYVQIGEEIKLRDLVYGLMLRSGNDAALAIANYLGGLDHFVARMNAKAKEIGMKNTNFINPHGLDEKTSNISTAHDMAILAQYANQYDEYKTIVGTKKYMVKTNYKTYVWINKNKLLTTYKYTTGGKTGYTTKSNRTLVTTATKNNLDLIVVTLDDPNDWTTHKSLYEYGFKEYKNYKILNKEKFNVHSDYYKEKLYVKNNCYYPLKIGETNNMNIKIELKKLNHYDDKDEVGVAKIFYKSELVHEEKIYVKVPKKSKNSFWDNIKDWFKDD